MFLFRENACYTNPTDVFINCPLRPKSNSLKPDPAIDKATLIVENEDQKNR